MKKPKKITVKFFINTHLAPISQNQKLVYPVYMQVTYNRKNTQIKTLYADFHANIQEFKQQQQAVYLFEERIMQKAVAYELSQNETDFKLRGLGEKYEIYASSIHFLMSAYLKAKFKNYVPQLRPAVFVELLHFDKQKIDFLTLYEACLRLFENTEKLLDPLIREEIELYKAYYNAYKAHLFEGKYTFPVVIDWLDGTHLQELESKVISYLGNDLAQLKKLILFINKIVSTKLEMR
ncbi:MAG: hypothetical protein NZ551_06875 [Microscillaceae bacterium]|nr:hypothetical protein [Microscillaceae bacterium]MDW8460917.1 hypothetical protein [Cytophagales bacterium]